VTDTLLEGLALEVLTGGASADASGAVLEGLALEVMRRLDPGEAQITQFRVAVLANNFPAEVRVTSEHVSVSTTNDPSEARVTSEYVSFSGTDDPSKARVTHLYVQVLADNINIPVPVLERLEGCDLLLQVFDDDRETVRWQASTNLDVPVPYLVFPDRYATQEIDAGACAATLGTVSVAVIDKAQTVGDQDSGWMTAKLAHLGVADIAGRRARLLRALPDPATPAFTVLEVVLDGVAGTPHLDPSYAAYSFDIRDTRESERKVRCFDGNALTNTVLLPSVAPGRLGTPEGYGYNAETDTYLLPQIATGLTGTFIQNDGDFPSRSTGGMLLTGNPADNRTITLKAHASLAGQSTEQGPTSGGVPIWERVRFPNLALWWRADGSSDPWTVIDGAHLVLDIKRDFQRYNLATATTDLGNDLVRIDTLSFGDDRLAGPDFDQPAYSPALPGAALPGDGQAIEVMLVSYGPPSTSSPLHIEGLTAGEFAQNVYDGVYSARDADGAIVPTAIRYDPAAVLAMTDPVRMRITEPIKDARDWLEKYIYAPTGWIPALDRFGLISPVYQGTPDDLFSLPLIYDEITEPSPSWDAGQRIINIVRFTYQRDYLPEDSDNAETVDGLADRDVVLEFQDPVSVDRHGEQVLEIDGRCFRALGDGMGEPVLAGGLSAELGYVLAFARRDHVLNRYALGAPTMQVAVRRDFTPTLRAGSWVRVWLSWFPDYVTGKRGLVTLCQITAIGDLDCVWRQVTMEQVLPLELYDAGGDFRLAMLTGNTGKILINDGGKIVIRT